MGNDILRAAQQPFDVSAKYVCNARIRSASPAAVGVHAPASAPRMRSTTILNM